jgi:hypothetical protein
MNTVQVLSGEVISATNHIINISSTLPEAALLACIQRIPGSRLRQYANYPEIHHIFTKMLHVKSTEHSTEHALRCGLIGYKACIQCSFSCAIQLSLLRVRVLKC